ncbi:MAG: TerB family tellurite resistance protein [Chloroflexota bacterium]
MTTVTFSDMGKAMYGINNAPIEAWYAYGYALITIAGADGNVSKPEMDWLINHFAAVGAPQMVLDAWQAFDAATGDLDHLLGQLSSDIPLNYARVLLYDAIRMARADDNYAREERDAVAKAARILRIDSATAGTIESVVDMESAVNKARQSLFMAE